MEYRIPQYVTTVKKEGAPRQEVQRVVVHTGVTEIAEDAFRGWTNLREVVFESGSRLRRVGDHAFADTALREFAAPEGLRVIGSGTFMNCKELRTVKLNEGLESLGEGAFRDSGVEEVHLPSSLRMMDGSVFAGCGRLQRVEMGADCGALAVVVRTSGGALAVEARREVREDSDGSVQIELEDADALREQLEQSKKQIEELRKQLAGLAQQCDEQDQKFQKYHAQPEKIAKPFTFKLKLTMSKVPCAMVMPDGTELIKYGEYRGKDYERVSIPNSVTKIEDYAFRGCKNLKQIVFEEGSKLEEIGWHCFQNSGLQEITLPKSLKKISNYAFEDCKDLKIIYVEDGCGANLSDLEISNSVKICPPPETMVGSVRVWDLRKLKDVVIPEGTERIGNHWFWGCNIESVKIPASVKYIDANAFCRCKSLKRVEFAQGSKLEKIKTGCFSESGLTEISIPNSVISIEDHAFCKCQGLKRVAFTEGNKLAKIGSGCFCNTGIETITISKDVEEIQDSAFKGCEHLKQVAFEEGSKLKTIGKRAFECCSNLTEILLPKGLQNIGDSAFSDCESLKNIQLPDGLKKIGAECFSGSDLEEVVIPGNVAVIEEGAFNENENLKRVSFQEGSRLEKIGENCFYGAGIEEFLAPQSLREIGDHAQAFHECMNLERVVLNEGLERLGEVHDEISSIYYVGAFSSSKIKQITLPSTLKVLGDYAFQECKQLSKVTSRRKTRTGDADSGEWEVCPGEVVLPDALEKVGTDVFYSCPEIKAIWVRNSSVADSLRGDSSYAFMAILPARSTMVGNKFLWDLRKLRNVVIPEGVQEIGKQWFKNTEIERVTIPASVRYIRANAFCSCTDLKRVAFAEGSQLEEIGEGCFREAGIEEITLPSTLKKIGKDVFKNCQNLKTVQVEEGCALDVRKYVGDSVEVHYK